MKSENTQIHTACICVTLQVAERPFPSSAELLADLQRVASYGTSGAPDMTSEISWGLKIVGRPSCEHTGYFDLSPVELTSE